MLSSKSVKSASSAQPNVARMHLVAHLGIQNLQLVPTMAVKKNASASVQHKLIYVKAQAACLPVLFYVPHHETVGGHVLQWHLHVSLS